MKKFNSFLVFFIPFIVFFFYFTSNNEHNLSSASHMQHDVAEIPGGYKVPSVNISVTQDMSGTWLLGVNTANFSFAPKKVGSELPSYNEGHAHLYINGKKVNRLYGQYYNLGTLKKGKNEIMVTLNSNDHGVLTYRGKPIRSSVIVNTESE
ncbi:hypothetical protein J7E38_17540 [Bacillus sp. ISL-35]|uniref:hypothetical protein n=1 Tax=Bacillus sp. ISL-35 TaxID=2819122 RepID=UPI001BEC807C|nr:hypothetical protein [Bacillus sp. ISL-35]MBT2680818.1 hypothetical protein [Bacillus sp. ISL-35]MBT2705628.1 hypothetical protein [Chryseobacterium sp. ISL-80]